MKKFWYKLESFATPKAVTCRAKIKGVKVKKSRCTCISNN